MTVLNWPPKDPDDVLDYSINWVNRLIAGDPIVSSTWVVPSGLSASGQAIEGTVTTVWLSGGTAAVKPYQITNRVTTSQGRVMDQTVSLLVTNR